MPDVHPNFAFSTVATAPSPASSGTSLVVASGEGVRFATTPPFNAVVCPAGSDPTSSNAEIVRVTARTTDTLTITRQQEGTSARTVTVGDRIYVAVTAKSLTDIELTGFAPVNTYKATTWHQLTPGKPNGSGSYGTLNRVFYVPIWVGAAVTFEKVQLGLASAGTANSVSRLAIGTNSSTGLPGNVIVDAGTVATVTNSTWPEWTLNWSATPGMYWVAIKPEVAAPGNFMRLDGIQVGVPLITANQQNAAMLYVDSSAGAYGTAGTALPTATANFSSVDQIMYRFKTT